MKEITGTSEEVIIDIPVPKKESVWSNITVWHWISMLMNAVIMICGVVDKNWALTLLGIYMLNNDLRYHLQQWDIKQLQDKVKKLENGRG